MKVRRNISVDLDTNEKLKRLAKRDHRNVSQWITEKVWDEVKAIKSFNRSNKDW